MLRLVVSSLFAGMLVLLSSVAGAATAKEQTPLRIAVIDPFSGSMAGVGMPSLKQMQFDAARINEQGGINGHPIQIIPFDNKLDPRESLVQLQKAVSQDIRYVAQMAGDAVASSLINAVDKHNQRNPDNAVLYLNYGANGPEFTNNRCSFWHFLFDANTEMKMKILTDWVTKQKDIHKVYIMNPDYSYGHEVSEYARNMLKEKRPDIKVVGDVFVPTGKVKDFSPYVSQIKLSGADAVITGNWGQDMILLIKSASTYGLKIPFITLYANSPGTANALGDKGVDEVYLVSLWSGDLDNPEIIKRQATMKKETGYDYLDLRATAMLDMLKEAAEKAGSIDPEQVAFALEGLKYDSLTGPAVMRAEDHQILVPVFISTFKDGMKYGLDDTKDLNFKTIDQFSAEQTAMSTTCHMRRPTTK